MKFKDRSKDERLAIKVYSGELALFAIIFAVIGVLRIVGVIGYSETRRLVFNYITLAGAAWGIADFIWALASKKRRQRISLVDKIVALPLVAFMITYDLICLISKPSNTQFYVLCVGIAILYAAAMLMFQAIYHFFRPLGSILDAANECEKEKPEEQAKPEETPEEKKTE